MTCLVETTASFGAGSAMITAGIVVACASPIFRRGLKYSLAACEPSWAPVEAGSFQAVLDLVHAGHCDVLLLDADLIGQAGGCLRPLRGISDGPRIIVMGERTDRAFILRWLDAGARGYLPTSADPAQVDCAIRTVLFGGVFMPPSVAAPVTIDFDTRADRSSDAVLTARQQEVFELLLLGLSTKQIARRLDLAVATVSIQLATIFRAFGARSRSEVVGKALFPRPPRAIDERFRRQAY